MLTAHARPTDCALRMLNCADRFAALHAFPYMLIKVFLAVLLSALFALLRMLIAIVLLVTADNTLQGVVSPDRALACRTSDVFLFSAANLRTGLAGPGMLLADRLSTRTATERMLFTDWFQADLAHSLP